MTNNPSGQFGTANEVDISKFALQIIEHLALQKDTIGLDAMDNLLIELMWHGIEDKHSDFVSLSEYARSYSIDIKENINTQDDENLQRLKLLIHDDLQSKDVRS